MDNEYILSNIIEDYEEDINYNIDKSKEFYNTASVFRNKKQAVITLYENLFQKKYIRQENKE